MSGIVHLALVTSSTQAERHDESEPMSSQPKRSISGYIRVEPRQRGGRVWVATYVTHAGPRTRKVLGPAWVRDTGRRTAAGGTVWRADNGICPDRHLTPKAAREALGAILERERALVRSSSAGRDITVGQLLDAWLRNLETQGGKRGRLSPSTLNDYASIVKTLKGSAVGEARIVQLTPDTVRTVQEHLAIDVIPSRATPMADSRRRQVMQRLRQALDFAVVRRWLTENPARLVDLPANPRPHADFNILEPSRVEAVARAVEQLPDYDLPLTRAGATHRHLHQIMQRRRSLYADAVRFSAYTGVRVGELRALRWRDIDFTGHALRVSRNKPSSLPAGYGDQAPKSGRGRSVPLTPGALAALERISQLGYAIGPESLVFATEGDGPIDGGRLRDAFYRGIEVAGLGYLRTKPNPIRWHDLRHTFGTMAVRVFPLTDVQAYMGHSNIQTTMRYVHHTPRTDAAAKLAAVFEQDLNPIGILEARVSQMSVRSAVAPTVHPAATCAN